MWGRSTAPSEGKGVVVAHLADRYNVHVRVGSPNAGHSFYHKGEKHVQQQIPCGWINPYAWIVIGRGAIVNPTILKRELDKIRQYDMTIRTRVLVDAKAGVLDEKFHHEEGGTEGAIHDRIGSTGEGVGAARVARLRRDNTEFRLFEDVAWEFGLGDVVHSDTPRFLREQIDKGTDVLLEGTQGSALSLIHGPWPFVTSTDTNAAQMAADCGLPPYEVNKIMLVARTFPIRVAGNSGPMKNETTWDEISNMMGRPTEERTTVTKKVRRVGMWDHDLMDRAILLNGPSSIALTFMDYWNPEDEGKTHYSKLSDRSKAFVRGIEQQWNVPVSLIGTGGEGWKIIERSRQL